MILLKWLITGFIIYFLYKRFFALPPPREENNRTFIRSNQSRPTKDQGQEEDEYIDYEEVD